MGARCCWAQRNRPLSAGNAASLALSWSKHTHTHTQAGAHTQCIRYKHRKCFGSLTQAAGGLDGTGWGVRLAQFRGEQASNTNQGDLVMDAGLTESPFVFGWTGQPTALRSHTSCPAVYPTLLGKSSSNFLIIINQQMIGVLSPFLGDHTPQRQTKDCCQDYISRLVLPHQTHLSCHNGGEKSNSPTSTDANCISASILLFSLLRFSRAK